MVTEIQTTVLQSTRSGYVGSEYNNGDILGTSSPPVVDTEVQTTRLVIYPGTNSPTTVTLT